MSTNTKKSMVTLAIGCLAMQLLQQTSFAMTPSLASFQKYWPDVSYNMIAMLQTGGYLAIIPAAIFGGAVAGTKIKYKPLAIISVLLVLVGGLLPFFFHESFGFVLFTRIICGLGIGLTFNTCSALLTHLFTGKVRGRMQGIATIVLTCSGIVYQGVGGVLCAINTHYVWLIHLFLIIPLALIIAFLREPSEEEVKAAKAEEDAAAAAVADKPSRDTRAILIQFAFGIFMIMPYCVVLNMSTIVDYNGWGSSALAGLIGTFYTIGGLVSGVLVGPVYMIFKKRAQAVSIAILIAGMACCAWGGNVIMMIVSEFFVGLGTFLLSPICIRDTNSLVNLKGLSFCGGLMAATWNAGAFVSGPFISTMNSILGENPTYPIRAAVVGAVIIGVVWIAVRWNRPVEKEEEGLYIKA